MAQNNTNIKPQGNSQSLVQDYTMQNDPTWKAVTDEHATRKAEASPMLKTLWFNMPLILFFVFFFWMLYCMTLPDKFNASIGMVCNAIGWIVCLEWCEIRYKG